MQSDPSLSSTMLHFNDFANLTHLQQTSQSLYGAQCHSVTVSQCHSVTVSQCHSVTVSLCRSVAVSQCRSVTVSQCRSVAVSQCHSGYGSFIVSLFQFVHILLEM